MSKRNLKKLQCQQVPDECQAAVVDELSASSPSVQSVSKPCNRFDLLKNVQDESDDDVNDDDEVDEPDETPPTSKPVASKTKKMADVKETAPIYLPPNDSIDINSRPTNTRTESQIVPTSSASLQWQSFSLNLNSIDFDHRERTPWDDSDSDPDLM